MRGCERPAHPRWRWQSSLAGWEQGSGPAAAGAGGGRGMQGGVEEGSGSCPAPRPPPLCANLSSPGRIVREEGAGLKRDEGEAVPVDAVPPRTRRTRSNGRGAGPLGLHLPPSGRSAARRPKKTRGEAGVLPGPGAPRSDCAPRVGQPSTLPGPLRLWPVVAGAACIADQRPMQPYSWQRGLPCRAPALDPPARPAPHPFGLGGRLGEEEPARGNRRRLRREFFARAHTHAQQPAQPRRCAVDRFVLWPPTPPSRPRPCPARPRKSAEAAEAAEAAGASPLRGLSPAGRALLRSDGSVTRHLRLLTPPRRPRRAPRRLLAREGRSRLSANRMIPEGGQGGRVRPVPGEGGRNSRRQGFLGKLTGPGTWLSPQISAPARPPRPPCPPSGITPTRKRS